MGLRVLCVQSTHLTSQGFRLSPACLQYAGWPTIAIVTNYSTPA